MKKLILALLSLYVCFAYHGMQAAGLESEAVESEAVESEAVESEMVENEMVVVGDEDGFGFTSDDVFPTHAPLSEAVPSAQQAFEAPYVIRLGGRSFACSACGYTINRQDRCQNHIDNHPKTREEGTCSGCSVFFLFNKHLEMHKKINVNKKPGEECVMAQACTLCDASFVKPSDLERHIVSHTNAKDYMCDVCDRGFGKESELNSHMGLHKGKKFRCCVSGCGKKYTQLSSAKGHAQKSHQLSKEEITKYHEIFYVKGGLSKIKKS